MRLICSNTMLYIDKLQLIQTKVKCLLIEAEETLNKENTGGTYTE